MVAQPSSSSLSSFTLSTRSLFLLLSTNFLLRLSPSSWSNLCPPLCSATTLSVEWYRSCLNNQRTLWVWPWCVHWQVYCVNVGVWLKLPSRPYQHCSLHRPPLSLSLSEVVPYYLFPPPPIWSHPVLLGMFFFVVPHFFILNVWVLEGSNKLNRLYGVFNIVQKLVLKGIF